jgi:type II secretory pathway component PulF
MHGGTPLELFGASSALVWPLLTLVWMLLPLPLGACLAYFLVSLPLRRQERVRLFVDLLEVGFKEGYRPEAVITAISKSRERSVGLRFHHLAAYLENGRRLSEALAKVPHWLPPAIVAMLRAGEEIGDLGAMLPACRVWARAGTAQVLKGFHYLMVLTLVVPFTLVIVQLVAVFVWPRFEEILRDMEVPATTSLADYVIGNPLVIALTVLLPLVVAGWAVAYVGGTRLVSWSQWTFRSLADGVLFAIPWRRKRMQRDFSATLALLLDRSVPEKKAVALAAECADNRVFRAFAVQTAEELSNGVKLTEAIRHLDDAGEFRWRLTNAAQARGGFLAALRGWHEALEAKAFQQEQAATQVFTTGLVLVNGLIVGLLVVGVFQLLIGIINAGVLW